MIERTPQRGISAAYARSAPLLLVLVLTSLAIVAPTSGRAAVDLSRTVDFHISAQPLDTALLEFSKQAKIQVAVNAGSLRRINAPPVNGQLAAGAALSELLVHSGLEYGTVGDTVTVAPAVSRASVAEPQAPSGAVVGGSVGDARSDRLTKSSDSEARTGGSSPQRADLEEVLVSAQKRTERLQDVPVPVTAISAANLVENNQLRLQDYYNSIPGLSLTPGDVHGAPILAIRGLTTGGFSNPTVGITVDDVPSGSSTNLGGGYEAPDIDPSELQRVEVLRGPQGTLYGASSIGGLLKFVTSDPSTEALTGRIQGGVGAVHNGSEAAYSVRGSVNVPVSDTVAVRASGFTRRDPGYIDNPVLHIDGVNRTNVDGGRLSGLWSPSPLFSVKLSALLQNSRAAGSSDVYQEPGLGDLQQNAVPGTGIFNKKIQSYSATANAKFGTAELTSVTAYGITDMTDSFDYSFVFGGYTNSKFGVSGTAYQNHYKTKKFTEEVRLSMPIGTSFDWLVGAFYTHEDSHLNGNLMAADPLTGAIVGALFQSDIPTRFAEVAGFTDLTVHFTDQFDVQFGARESRNKQSYAEDDVGPLVNGSVVNPKVDSKDNAFTYLVTPRFKLAADEMLYARLASGYRPGGPNPNSTGLGLPSRYGPDKTLNYEIGFKGDFIDRKLSIDTSVYYIDWKDMQLQLSNAGFLYYVNAGRAKSEGVEFAVNARPWTGMTVSTWVVWNNAELTANFPTASAAHGTSGDRLPDTSRFSGNVALDQSFPLGESIAGFVGGSVAYVGDRQGNFTATQRQTFPGYAKADFHAGANYQGWTLNIFVDNLTDKRGMLAGGLGTLNPIAFKFIQPRTVGLSLAKSF